MEYYTGYWKNKNWIQDTTINEIKKFILKSFIELLKEEGLFMESSLNVKEISVSCDYISVKKKFWSVLSRVNEYLKNEYKLSFSDERSYKSASTSEEGDDEFRLYFTLGKGIWLNVGFLCLDEDYEPSVGLYLTVNDSKDAAYLEQRLRDSNLEIKNTDEYSDNEWGWHEDEEILVEKYSDLKNFIGENALEDIIKHLENNIKELLLCLIDEPKFNHIHSK